MTNAGVCYTRHVLAFARSHDGQAETKLITAIFPSWDSEHRRLWLGKHLLKEFRQAASNQVAILTEFHKKGWTIRRIDNPLEPDPGESMKDRCRHLQETVKNLNRGLPKGTIRFYVGSGGNCVQWDFCRNGACAGIASNDT